MYLAEPRERLKTCEGTESAMENVVKTVDSHCSVERNSCFYTNSRAGPLEHNLTRIARLTIMIHEVRLLGHHVIAIALRPIFPSSNSTKNTCISI
jgi:hypothetical protein